MKDAIADFAHYLLRLSVIQMMQQTNPPFQVAQESSIATLTDIAQHYIESLGTFAKQRAERGGRTEINILDFMEAYQHMHPGDDLKRITNLRDFAKSYSTAFGKDPVPDFPAKRRKLNDRTFDITADGADTSGGGTDATVPGRGAHIPSFAPPFPKPHTYSFTEENAVDRIVEADKVRKETLEQRTKVQSSLSNIKDKLTSSSSGEDVLFSKPKAASGGDIFTKVPTNISVNRFSAKARMTTDVDSAVKVRMEKRKEIDHLSKLEKIVEMAYDEQLDIL